MAKNIVIVILLAICLILLVFYIDFLVFYWSPTNTGVFGDTIGGLLSPIIGFLSIIFIFISFKDQRSVPLYLEFCRKLDDLIADCEKLEYTHNGQIYKGKYAVELFNEQCAYQSFRDETLWPESHRAHFDEILLILKRTSVFYSRLNTLGRSIGHSHMNDIRKNFSFYYDTHLDDMVATGYYCQRALWFFLRQRLDTKFDENIVDEINYAISGFAQFRKVLDTFVDMRVLYPKKSMLSPDAELIWTPEVHIDEYQKLLPITWYGLIEDTNNDSMVDKYLKKFTLIRIKLGKVLTILRE